jgi:hypothetical protein
VAVVFVDQLQEALVDRETTLLVQFGCAPKKDGPALGHSACSDGRGEGR